MRRASVAKSPIRSSLAARWYSGLTTGPNVISSSWSHVGWSTIVGRSLSLTTVRRWHQERKRLAVDPVVGNRPLSFRRSQPINESATEVLFDMRVFCRVYEHDPVLVEEPPITLNDDF